MRTAKILKTNSGVGYKQMYGQTMIFAVTEKGEKMSEMTFRLNSPLTKEDWNLITDAEFEHSDGVTFTTPSGKEVEFRKVVHGEWVPNESDRHHHCSVCMEDALCKEDWQFLDCVEILSEYCPNCGARMDRGR